MSCRTLRIAPLLAGLLLLGLGCGVADYESKMILAQQRLERFDKEDKMLGQPLVIPKHLDKLEIRRPWANLFVRPPKGIRPQFVETDAEEPEPVLRGSLLYDYVPPAKQTAGGVARVELAFGEQKDFVAQLLGNFTGTSDPKKSQRTFRPTGRQMGITFETIEMEGTDGGIDYLYSINRTATQSGVQIAIVYWVIKSEVGKVKASGLLDISLESFALEEDANRSRELFARGSPLLVPQRP
jgi:hypothetical protein